MDGKEAPGKPGWWFGLPPKPNKGNMNVQQQEELIAQKKREIEAKLEQQAKEKQQAAERAAQLEQWSCSEINFFFYITFLNVVDSGGSANNTPASARPQKKPILFGKRPGLGVGSMLNQMKMYSHAKQTPVAARPSVFLSPDEEEDDDLEQLLEIKVLPPEDASTRDVIEKLARFVAEGGPEIEKMAMEDYKNNSAFGFLSDPNSREHLYYKKRMAEFKMEKLKSEAPPKVPQKEQCCSFLYEPNSKGYKYYRFKLEEYQKHKDNGGVLTPAAETAEKRKSPESSEVESAESQPADSSASSCTKKRKKSRWGPEEDKVNVIATPPLPDTPALSVSIMQQMFDMIMKHKQAMAEMQIMWEKAIRDHQHEYDSDEDVDNDQGTWEHQLRKMEMEKTREWAEQLTEMGRGKHFIGDFLPPDELEKFMETFKALKEGREPDYSEYKEFKLTVENLGYQMLMKMGWKEGEGLGSDGQGITAPVNK
ncbi:SURP and G-patch domain-containing protein 1 [Protopterus annectens]|uniref:SURP and G-patch domain-containing protein 1 n=1 Tax=Protopterus annectens TaxID=7888 RepID=UPI001CFA1F25|nr:SURP and G-patch domain-containing protein 1 [Protopterus annectens]